MPRDMRAYRGYGNRRYSRRITFLISLCIFLVAAGVALFVLLTSEGPTAGAAGLGEGFDPSARAGTLSGEKAGELLGEDEFRYAINAQVTLKDGKANLRLENPPENRQLMKVTITLEDGTLFYESGFIKPFYVVEEAKISNPPKKGSYTATAVIEAYDQKDQTLLTTAQQEIQITVE